MNRRSMEDSRPRGVRGGWLWLLALGAALWLPAVARAQDDGPDLMKVINRVAELEPLLQDDNLAERDRAEAELLKLGPAALDYLQGIADDQTTDLRERLVRIRTGLERQAVESVSNPGVVRLAGEQDIATILAAIRQQTGNRVVLGDRVPVGTDELRIETGWDGTGFWDVLEHLRSRAGLEVDPYLSRPGELALSLLADRGAAQHPESTCRTTAGVLSLDVLRIDTTRNLANPQANGTTIRARVNWEPRMKPIQIKLPMNTVRIVDDRGVEVPVSKPDQVVGVAIQPEIPQTEMVLPLPLLDRQAGAIGTLEGTIVMTVPGRTETFEFTGIRQTPDGTRETRGGATVTFEGLRKNVDLHEVRLSLSFDQPNEGMESHLNWALQNEVFLRGADGSRVLPIASETFQQAEYRLGVAYLFPELPDDAALVYRSPAAIVKLSIPFVLRGIPLP